MHPSMFIAALFTVAKIQKKPKCPSADDSIKKLRCTHTHTHTHTHTMGYYSVTKKDDTLPFATTWMDLEHIV